MFHSENKFLKYLKITIDRVSLEYSKFQIMIHADRKSDSILRSSLTADDIALAIGGK